MSSPMDMLLNAVKNSIGNHAGPQSGAGFDPGALVNEITGLFAQHQQVHGPAGVLPASQDPYGDPGVGNAAGARGNIKPASADPYGDPADEPRRR